MKHVIAAISVLSMAALSGCIGELWAIRTTEDIQKSEYRAEYQSSKSVDIVHRCMMQTLHGHKNAEGKRPYADVATRDFGSTHDILLKTPQRPAAGMYDVGGEILFLIENAAIEPQQTRSSLWVHQYMLSPSPKDSLDMLGNVVKVCL